MCFLQAQQPEPKPAPAKSQGKKCKLVTKTSDKPSPAKRSKPGLVTKRRKPTSSLRSVDEFVDEGISGKEPRFDDEEANIQRAVEESLKSVYDAPRGPLPLVVIREPESGKYQLLPETPKKKSPVDQFIFQRRISTPTESSGHDESSSLYVELSPVVHVGPNLKHMDLEAMDVSTQPHLEKMDEGFTATAYPKVQENLKPIVEEQVILEEPASSTGTMSSLQHLAKDLSFGDLFFNDKPSEADNEKTTVETKAESMVSVTIQQDTSSIPPMTTPIIDLTSRPDSPNVHRLLQATAAETTMITTTTTHPPPPQPQQRTTYSMLMKRIDELEQIMANLIQDNKHLEERLNSHGELDWASQAPLWNRFRDLLEEDMKEILHQRIWETNSYKTHEDHMMLYEALEKSMNRDHTDELLIDLAEARKKKKKRRDSPKTPHGSPPRQPPPPPPPPPGQSHSSTAPSSSKTAASAEYKAWKMTDTRIRPSASSTLEDLHMDDDMAPDTQAHSSDDEDIENAHIPKYQMEECHKLLTDSVDDSIIRHIVSKPLPLGGPPGQVTIQSDFLFNKDLEYLRYGSKGNRPAHTSKGDRRAVRTHMQILRVVRIKVFSMYGYDYMKKIVLRSADLHEHIIAERDFKYLYPSNFEDLYLLNLQGQYDESREKSENKERVPTEMELELEQTQQGSSYEVSISTKEVAVCFTLRSLEPKRTIESRAKRSSKIISLGHYSIMLASSHTVKSKTNIKSPTHYPHGIARTSE
nr:hypothetical protein [Tanacetum cinerariifolium]